MDSEEKIYRKLLRQFFLLIALSFIAMVFVLLFASCGARKVNKSDTKEQTEKKEKIVVENDVTALDNITIESKSFVIDSTKEEIEELIISPIDILKPAYYENKQLTNTKLVKRKIKRNKAITSNKNINTQHDSKTHDKSKETSEKAEQSKKNEKTKGVEQEQFNLIDFLFKSWWILLIILVIVIIIWWFCKKYKDKIAFVYKKLLT